MEESRRSSVSRQCESVVDVFLKLDKSGQSPPALPAHSTEPHHGLPVEVGVVPNTGSMSTNGTPQATGDSSNGSHLPESRTSFQSSTPRTVLSSEHAPDERDIREKELLQHLSQRDSISEELQYHTAASSFEDLEPQMASTPVKGGRNVSMTKMLMSSGQFDSALELLTDETERSHEKRTVGNEKPLSQYTPVKESLRNIQQEAVVDEKESFSSSVEIIEKYSGPGALTDFVNPYKVASRSSTESKDFDQNDRSKNVQTDESSAINSEVSLSGVTSQEYTGDDSESENRHGYSPKTALEKLKQESENPILLQRKGSRLKMKTVSSTDGTTINDTESSLETQAAVAVVSDVPSAVTPKESGTTGRIVSVKDVQSEDKTPVVQTSKMSRTMQYTDERFSSKCPSDPAFVDTPKTRQSVGSHSVDNIPVLHYPNRCPRMEPENYTSSQRETVQENKSGVHDDEIHDKIAKRTFVSPEVEKLKKMKLVVKMDSSDKETDKTDSTNPKTFLEGEKQDVSSGAYTSGKVDNNLSDIQSGASIGAQANQKQVSPKRIKIPPTGAAIGLRPSLGEYKSPEMMLRQKQRKLTQKMLFSNDTDSSEPPVILSYWKKGDKVISPLAKTGNSGHHEFWLTHGVSPDNSSHSSRSDISDISVHEEQSGSSGAEDKLQMIESVVSHYSGEKYDTPIARLQRHVDRMRNHSQERNEGKGLNRERSDADIILDDKLDTDGMTQKHLVKDVYSEQDFEISRQTSKNRDECKGDSERSDSQGEIRESNIPLPKEYNPVKYPIDKSEKKSKQTESAASIPEYTTPSKLLQKHQEREGVQANSPGYGAFEYSTPSTLLQTRQSDPSIQDPNKESLPEYTTPSKLLQKHQEREGVHANSPGYGAFEYSTPSTLLQTRQSDPSIQDPNKESLPEYTTPSKLLQKYQDREGVHANSPGYGAFEYSTPSTLLQTRQSDPSIQDPNKESLPEYTTPSKLLQKYQDREGVHANSPGYGAFEYSTPSTLLQTRQSDPSIQDPNKESLPEYTTPSKLLQKYQDREGVHANSPGYGAFEYSTPSTLLQTRQSDPSIQDPNKESLPEYTTPSKLLQKYQEREGVHANSPGYGAFEYSTPSTLLQTRQSELRTQHINNKESLPDNVTPSQSMRRHLETNNRQKTEPGYFFFNNVTPSQMMWARENTPSGSGHQNQYVSCRGPNSDVSRERPLVPGLGTFSYTTPSQLGMQTPPHPPDCREPSDSGLLQTAGNKPGTKQDLDPALSDITTCFRRLSEMLTSAFKYSSSYSEPEFIKHHPDSSGNRFFPQRTGSNSDPGQRQPMPSQPLSFTRSTSSTKTLRPSTGESTDSGFGHSVSSLSYPDSVLTRRDSSLRGISNLSFEAYSDDENPAEEKGTIPRDLHSALSANEIFWELFNANPSLSMHVLGAEFDTAVQSLNQLYNSYCSGYPSSPPIPANPLFPRGPVSASALSTTSVNPAAHHSFQMTPDMHKSQENFDMDQSRPGDVQHKMSSSMSISPRTAASDMRSFMVEKEKMESQMRKLQVENSTLVTENKLMKEKFNRASAKVTELEQKLTTVHNEMDSLQTSMTTEISMLYDRTRSETQRDMDQFQARIVSLTRHNETLQAEMLSLEKQLESSRRETDAIRANAERSRAVEAYKTEAASLKTELDHVKMLLHQSESQVKAEIERAQNAQLQVVKLTEIRNLLQQQIDSGGMGSSVAEKQVQALEQRLRVTEDRLHQERADRANSLSTVEEKLLSENARLQSSEKGLTRQLQREKDKSRNLDQRCRELKVENENLRLSVPLDDSYLINDNTNIPCNKQSSQKQEQKKVSDIKFILSEMEKQAGLTADQEKEIICHLWNTCDSARRQLQLWELYLVDLELCGEDVEQGLQNLREMKGEYENKLHQVEEKIEDVRSEKMAFENTYKEQLSVLVKEKHEACARLQTLEDMMEAMKRENDMLRFSLASSAPDSNAEKVSAENEARVESLTLEIQNLTGQTSQLQRNSQQMQTEIETLRSQLQSRDQELHETRSQLGIAQSHHTDDSDNRRQHKIDQLTAKVCSLQDEVKSLSDRLASVKVENAHLEKQLEDATRQLALTQSRTRDLMSARTNEAKVRSLEAEMAQKESELLKMTAQFHESDMALQQTRQDLGFHQQHIADLEGQVESLEQQVVQRGQMLETACGKEQEQLQQFQLVKDSLDAVTNSLNHTRAEYNVIQLELSKERSRREAVEKELHYARQPRDPDADVVAPGAGSAMEVRLQELENELDRVRGQLVDAASVLQCKEEELSGERTETTRTREDLERERTTSCQVSAEKLQLHQQLKAVSEERNSLLEEKGQAEEDLIKLESRLQEVVHKFQMESSKHHDNFNTDYNGSQTPQDQQMLSEVKSLRLLVEGREKESMSLNDKISRQQMELGFLQRRIELLRQENLYNRDDVRRLTSQLLQKMKEKSATVELNTYLAREKSTLQHENKQLTRDVERERDITHRRKAEVSEIIKKMEKSETSQRDTVQELHDKQGHIAGLDTDLRQAKRENSYLDTENQQLKVKVNQLKEEVQKLTSIIHSLENRLEMEQTSLAGERSNCTKKKEELVSTQHKLDTLQREYKMLLNNLEAERRGYEQLKEELSSSEASEKNLREQLNSLQANHDSQLGQNLAHRDNLEQLQREKTAIFQDYQDVCRQLGEKEKKMCDLKDECGRQVEAARRDAAQQHTRMNQEQESMDRDLKMYKEEISELNEKLRQKDVQLNAFGRTLTQLEDVTREKKALEMKLEKIESAAEATKNQLESTRTEILGMKGTHSQLQESLAKTQMNYLSAQEQLRTQTESTSGQVLHLKHTISELKNQHEGERAHLREALNQAEANLRSVELALKNVTENRNELNADKKSLERSFEEVKTQVAEEVMNRKLLEQKSESQKSHLEDTKKKKESLAEKTAEQLARLARVESELQLERERVMTLTSQVQELEASQHGNQSAARAKQEQVDILQSEIGKLQHLLDTQKQQLGSKFRKAHLDIKHQLETSETEKTKLSQEAQQLSVQLEQAREQIAIKNKENLRLQEEILSLEEQVRENSSQLKQAMDSLRMEEQMQSDLNRRFSEQEEELRRLRTFLAKKAEEATGGENKGMWHEMNRVIQDLSRQMQQHLDSQKTSDKEARDREIKLANSFKKQVSTLESELKTERALHQITRSSLKSQEDDNQRLRDQMFALRRKSISPEKKYKSRSEEINELISRSQTRAQAILSSTGAYTDGTLKNISPTKDYNVNSNDLDRSQSPDTASQMSDISCGSNGPVYLAFLNSSGNWQTPGSGNVTPRKSP